MSVKKIVASGVLLASTLLLSSNALSAQVGFADIVVDYFDSGNGSLSCTEGQGGIYPPGATTANCVNLDVTLGDDPGPASDYLSLPIGSFITLGFIDEYIIDGDGDDIFISEVGQQYESAEIYVSSSLSTNDNDFMLLGTANGNTISSFDLASIGFVGPVKAVKVLSLANGGYPTAPGFDLAHIAAVNYIEVPEASNFGVLTLGLVALLVSRRSRQR